LLPEQGAVIYLDADSLLLGNLKGIWDVFKEMNSLQIAGMIAEDELPSNGHYNLKSKIPYYGPRGRILSKTFNI
jgi:hypothetical protein